MGKTRASRSIADKRVSIVVPRAGYAKPAPKGTPHLPGPDTVQPGGYAKKVEAVFRDSKDVPGKVAQSGSGKVRKRDLANEFKTVGLTSKTKGPKVTRQRQSYRID